MKNLYKVIDPVIASSLFRASGRDQENINRGSSSYRFCIVSGTLNFFGISTREREVHNMDEYLDNLLYSSSSLNVDVKERSPWVCSESHEPNGLVLSSVGVDKDDSNSPISLINSNHSTESMAAQDASSVVLGLKSEYGIDNKGLQYSGESHFQDENGVVHGSLDVGTVGRQYKMASPKPGSPNHETGSEFFRWKNKAEPQPVFQRFHKDFQTLCPIPLCPLPSYEGMSSMPPGMGQDRNIAGFGLPGGYVDNDLFVMESNSRNLSQSVISKVLFSHG